MKFYLPSVILMLFVTQAAFADTAYKWTDASGTVFYGSKPPSNAKGVQKIQPKNYSRYSSSKLLRGYTTPLNNGLSNTGRAALKQPPVRESDVELPKGGVKSPVEQTVRLESSRPALESGAKNEVKSCRTTVTNQSVIDVEGIQVAFEFSDGTLVTADGPSRLNAKQAALYSIPEENLPLALADGTKLDPKVIINSDADSPAPESER